MSTLRKSNLASQVCLVGELQASINSRNDLLPVAVNRCQRQGVIPNRAGQSSAEVHLYALDVMCRTTVFSIGS